MNIKLSIKFRNLNNQFKFKLKLFVGKLRTDFIKTLIYCAVTFGSQVLLLTALITSLSVAKLDDPQKKITTIDTFEINQNTITFTLAFILLITGCLYFINHFKKIKLNPIYIFTKNLSVSVFTAYTFFVALFVIFEFAFPTEKLIFKPGILNSNNSSPILALYLSSFVFNSLDRSVKD